MAPESICGTILNDAIVHENDTIESVIKHMDNEAAIVVDKKGRISGFVTDGDIRRALLKNATMKTPVYKIMTKTPLTVKEDDNLSKEEIMSIMLKKKIRHLPVIDNEGCPVRLEILRNQYEESDIPGVILMAGGKGARLRPLTYTTPKPLLDMGGEKIIDRILDSLRTCDINDVMISINYLGEQIKSHVKDGSQYNMRVNYVEEEKALGTAGALSLIQPKPTHSFIVMNADLITNLDFKAFANFHKKHKNDLTVCVRQIIRSIPFGVVKIKNNGKNNTLISGIDEKPEETFLVNAGIYMLEPHIIDLVPHNTFFDMVSLINNAINKGFKVNAFPIVEYWRDIGRHEQMQQALEELNSKEVVR